LEAIRLLRQALRHDVVITANVRNALILGLFKRLSGRRMPRHMMVEMRLDDPRPTLAWRAKVAIQRFAFGTVDAMCVSARREQKLYGERLHLPSERLRFVPWHTNVLEPASQPRGDYIFSAGRTGRDWRTLAAAVGGLDVKVVVVCSAGDAAQIEFPSNAIVKTDIPYEEYRQLLLNARMVLLPLEPHIYSSGQVVVLEAMALGKPVITSRVTGTEDYIQHEVTGMLTEPGDVQSLRASLERVLADPQLEERLATLGLEQVRRDHTLDAYLHTIYHMATSLA